jgi:hypothetical protein
MHEKCKEKFALDNSDGASASDHSPEGAVQPAPVTARRNRFANAVLIVDPGAVNPSGIAYAIIDACRDARADGIGTRDDAAVRLMVTQLAWICRADSDTKDYAELLAECRRRAVG